MDKQIRFIDSHYNELFTVPDGGNVVLTHFDGAKDILPCEYIDKRLARIGETVFHTREFAEEQECIGTIYAPENGHCDSYEIYQIADVRNTDYCFRSLAEAGEKFNRADYERVYAGVLASNMTLEYLYAKHNMDNRPFGRKMRSLSMSDVVVLKRDGKESAFYVDTFGFEEVPKFIKQGLPQKNRSKNRDYER